MIIWSELSQNFKIAQHDDKFKFGTDAVLLSNFANIKKNDKLVDMCSGSGVVGFLCFLKYGQKKTIFVDFDPEMIALSKLTAKANDFTDFFEHFNIDVEDLSNDIIPNHSVDCVTVNPPYFKRDSGKINEKADIKNARHSYEFSIDTLFLKTYNMLKDGGKIYIVHRCEYLGEVVNSMSFHKLEPKRIRFVHSYIDSPAKLVLIEGMKNAKCGLSVSSPLILYKDKNVKSDEFCNISDFYQKKDR